MWRLLFILLFCTSSVQAAIPIIFTRAGTNAPAVGTNCNSLDYTNAYAYWPMDVYTTSTPDIVGGRNVSAVGSIDAVVTGYISNAIQASESGHLHFDGDTNFSSALMITNDNGSSACGFSISCWWRSDVGLGGNTALVARNGDYFLDVVSTFRMGVITSGGTKIADSGTAVSDDGDWNYVVGVYDNVLLRVGVSVNGGAFTYVGATNLQALGAQDMHINENDVIGGIGTIDELAIWRNRVFSDADVALNYNSAYGTTYPFTAIRMLDPEGGHVADPEDGSLINDPNT